MADNVAIWIGVILGALALLMYVVDLVITLKTQGQNENDATQSVWGNWRKYLSVS